MEKNIRSLLSRNEILELNGKYLKEKASQLFKEIKIGDDILDLAIKYDGIFKKDKYKYIPLSMEIDYFVQNFAPVISKKLEKKNMVSFTMCAQYHKYDHISKRCPVKCAYSLSLDPEEHYYLIKAVLEASKEAIKCCGPDVRLTEPRNIVHEILDSYRASDSKISIKPVINIHSYNILDDSKIVPNTKIIPSTLIKACNGKMIEDEIYYIDIYGTNLPKGEVARNWQEYPTMFFLTPYTTKKDKKEYTRRINYLQSKKKPQLRLLRFMEDTFKRNAEIFTLRDFRTRYKSKFGKEFKFEYLRDINSLGLCYGIPAKYIDFGYIEKLKKIDELRKKQLELKKLGKETEASQMNEDIKKQQKNDSIAVHFGHTVLITKSGRKVIC